jgi:MFS family permease
MTQAAITLGIFLTSILGYGFVVYVEHGWQYMQAWSAIPALVMLAFHSYVPESPKWLLATMRSGEAGEYILHLSTSNPS